jgi:predicted nucleic acid-binding protein
LDTNILLRLIQPNHPHAQVAAMALESLRGRNQTLCLTQQNLVEFWAVITRPINANGLGYTTGQAADELESLKQLFVLLPELPLQEHWEQLVDDYKVGGKNVHDARLVAAMLVHGVENILTFNVQDFARFKQINVLDPLTLT